MKFRSHLTFRIASSAAAILLTTTILPGCGASPDYPAHLAFPSRTDRLVLKSPEKPPPAPPSPGKLEAELANLDVYGGRTAEPSNIPEPDRAALDQVLRDIFGTPAESFVAANDEKGRVIVDKLGLSGEALSEGGKLFRKHCVGCHGISGDGRGQAVAFTIQYPRDFRRGAFKFITTSEGGKPRHADLLRTITFGMEGTPMPKFGLLPESERDLLARYATYLSVRGQVEFETMAAHLPGGTGGDIGAFARGRLAEVLAAWDAAEIAPALPQPPADGEPGSETHFAAVRRGYELFIAKTGTECLKCHDDFGRKPVLRYDVWGTIATPANFTDLKVKGGNRPEDVYARVRYGIAPVGMPAHPKLSDRQAWDLVRFVLAAPKPRELPPDVREAVYPK